MYRLYVDEVGTDALANTENENHRYLSLTGVAMRIDQARDHLTPAMNHIKAAILEHDPDAPAILHRSDILSRKGIFGCLNDQGKCARFDAAIHRLIGDTEYTVITALIDKNWMLRQLHWDNMQPYHYLMEILVEKYVQFLERAKAIGDIMPEARGKPDKRLQAAYAGVREAGTRYVPAGRIATSIRSTSLKFREKRDNIAGLQLADLIAHPSHVYTRSRMGHAVNLGPFATQVVEALLRAKYDRSRGGSIPGYGIKHLPQ